MATVGVIVNPHAGKDIRRLVSAASHTSDSAKIGILRRVLAGAAETGVDRILVSTDSHRLAMRAADGLGAPVEPIEGPMTGSHLDTVAAAQTMWKDQAGAVVVVGGDGTCRDVATGWPDVPLIAISTGTNNVFPSTVDATSAGVAAGLVASGAVPLDAISSASKRVSLHIDDPTVDSAADECALVEAALIETSFVGARAVSDPSTIRWVLACIADPASTGLASIAGRIHPVDRLDAGGVLIRLGPGGRRVRVPLIPGTFATLDVASVVPIGASSVVDLPGGGVLAYDGERSAPVSPDATVTASINRSGPRLIDVGATLARAAADHLFDPGKDTHGD